MSKKKSKFRWSKPKKSHTKKKGLLGLGLVSAIIAALTQQRKSK